MHMFGLTVTWSATPFPLKPTRVHLYAQVSAVNLGAFAATGVCMEAERVRRFTPTEAQIAALDASLAFARGGVDIQMVDDTSDVVSTLGVQAVWDRESRCDFSVNVMASGLEGADVPAFAEFLGILGPIIGADLMRFARFE